MPPFPESPGCLSPFQETCFPYTASTFKPRIDSHHGGSWDSPVGKPRGKSWRESHRSLDPREGKRDTAARAREENVRACPHSRREPTPLRRLQKYPKIHVSTGEESSVSGTDFKQGLRPRHRRERNPERPTSNSHGDWTCFPCTASTFKPRIESHHGGTWDSTVDKTRGKATNPLIHAKGNVTLLLQLGRKVHVHAPTRDED